MTNENIDDIIGELDSAITNVGSDIIWKRKIGGIDFYLSPIPYIAQIKANETVSAKDAGPSVLYEVKRIILSFAIVGFDKFDLHEYRNSGPVFPVNDRSGKKIKVSLDRYIHDKIMNWDSQLVDDIFAVYSDLMESHQKENIKDIKFENAKDPVAEMMELVARISEIRERLNLPHLIDPKDLGEDFSIEEYMKYKEDIKTHKSEPEPKQKAIEYAEKISKEISNQEELHSKPTVTPEPVSEPMRQPRLSIADLENHSSKTTPDTPYVPKVIQSSDVIEERKSSERLPFPPIDRDPAQNRNPRFAASGSKPR
jgi:hypothetical protein